jgi:hypothetical protein
MAVPGREGFKEFLTMMGMFLRMAGNTVSG